MRFLRPWFDIDVKFGVVFLIGHVLYVEQRVYREIFPESGAFGRYHIV